MTEARDDMVPARVSSPPVTADGEKRAGARVSIKSVSIALIPFVVFGVIILFEIPICPARVFLGIPCPGCGLTRATEAMVVGDWATMVRYHPLAPIITPLFVYGMVRIGLVTSGVLSKKVKEPLNAIPQWAWTVLVTIVLGLWGLRLFGLLGGSPDGVDFTQGLLYRGAEAVIAAAFRG